MQIQGFESNKVLEQAHKTSGQISSRLLNFSPYRQEAYQKALMLTVRKLTAMSCYL
jgi:L-rhamnose isomerase